jgi:transcriptional regulator with XRE-family HTH domain
MNEQQRVVEPVYPNIMQVLRVRQEKTQHYMGTQILRMSQARYSQIESATDRTPPDGLLKAIAEDLGWTGNPLDLFNEWEGSDSIQQFLGEYHPKPKR